MRVLDSLFASNDGVRRGRDRGHAGGLRAPTGCGERKTKGPFSEDRRSTRGLNVFLIDGEIESSVAEEEADVREVVSSRRKRIRRSRADGNARLGLGSGNRRSAGLRKGPVRGDMIGQ